MKSDPPSPLGYHFLLNPPAAFTPTRNVGATFDPEKVKAPLPVVMNYNGYTARPFHRVFWSKNPNSLSPVTVIGENSEISESVQEIVAAGDTHVPLAYHLVQQRILSPGNVLDLLRNMAYVPAIAVSKLALDVMLGAWVRDLFDGVKEPPPLVAGRPLDIGVGGESYVDSDPVTEKLVSDMVYDRTSNPLGVPLGRIRIVMRTSAMFPGEVPAAILARVAARWSDLWRYGGYTRGTLRQVFAGYLSTKGIVGPLPEDAVLVGPHTDDSWYG